MFLEREHSFINSRRLLSTQFHYSRVCYSDASSTGCASYMLDLHNTISHKLWSVDEVQKSSSYRELKAVSLGLESFLPLLKGRTIKWYTDNQSVARIVEVGSMKEDLKCLACVFLVRACSVASHWKWNGFRDRLMIELIF